MSVTQDHENKTSLIKEQIDSIFNELQNFSEADCLECTTYFLDKVKEHFGSLTLLEIKDIIDIIS